jgi:hypothetical protein
VNEQLKKHHKMMLINLSTYKRMKLDSYKNINWKHINKNIKYKILKLFKKIGEDIMALLSAKVYHM